MIISGILYHLQSRDSLLDRDIFLFSDDETKSLVRQEPAAVTESILAGIAAGKKHSSICVDYPFDKSVFPPEIVPPAFLWHDSEDKSDLWLIDITFAKNPYHIYVVTSGKRPEPVIDPEAVSSTNEHYKPSDYDLAANAWTPVEGVWESMKRNSTEEFAALTITGFNSEDMSKPLSQSSTNFMTSKDPVGAPIFYRDVPLMPSETKSGLIKPISKKGLPLIAWRLRDISRPSAPVVLKDMPTCANCHSFSLDGKVLGMDMDGPGGDKGAYGLTKVKKKVVITDDDIITWNSYKYSPPGHENFGLFSQVSPDGRYVISTLNEATFVVNYPNFEFLQSFYPTRGIFAFYDSRSGQMKPLPGANDTKYVHTNAGWSPDGANIVFSRAKACDKYQSKEMPKHVGDPNETFIQYDLYTMPFNEGRGGIPSPVKGASGNGMSNSFPRYSPDGRWIVFVQSERGQLMRPDSKLYIIPAQGGHPRKMNCNLPVMNSWHSWSPNSRWLVFSSKGFTPFTQMFLTHIDENGQDTPPILIPNSTAANRAVNIPEFLYNSTDAIASIETPSQQSYSHFNKANELAELGRFSEALAELEKSLELNPYYAKAYNDMGYILFKTDKSEEAVTYFNKAMELDPGYASACNNLGFVLESQGKIEDAESRYRRALEIDPALTGALCNMGNLLRSQGKLDEAISHYRKALEIKPYLTEAQSNLGVAFQLKGDIDEAISCFYQALEIDNDYVPAHYNLGLAYQSQGKVDEAIDCFQKAVGLQFDYVPAHYSLGAAFQLQGKADEAADQYLKVLQFDPDHTNTHYGLGVIMAMKGHFDAAAKHFQAVIESDTNHADAHYNLAGVYSNSGRMELAAEHYRAALAIRPDYLKSRIGLANALVKLRRTGAAVEQHRKIIEIEPRHVPVLNMLAWILATSEDADISDPTEAVALAQKACRLTDFKVPQVLDTLAAAYASAGNFIHAVKTAQKAVDLARTSGRDDLAERIAKRLELYKRNEPFREKPESEE